jgi:hypothetical protein
VRKMSDKEIIDKLEHFFDEDYVDFHDFVYGLDLSDRTKELIMRCLYFDRNYRIVKLFLSKEEQ